MSAQKLNKINLITNYLDEILPNAGCELNYNSDYGFLIAVMLSAQVKDSSVNKVTKILFEKYKTINELANADIKSLEEIIKPLGLYKHKAKNVKEISNLLVNKYNGKVPQDKDVLTRFPGVGIKTANVVRAEIFKIPEFPVDTHVKRISNRLSLVVSDDVSEIEEGLKKIFPKNKWIKLHHQFIHFGRYRCDAKKPACEDCKLKNICSYFGSTN